MNIILIGYRGSGKTSIGRKLADQLWKDFVDVDAKTLARFGDLTVAEVWEQQGEPAYREAEGEVTAELCSKDGQVIALGGGTPMIDAARAAIKASDAVRVYLYADAQTLHDRIESDAATAGQRPALTDQGGGLDEVRSVLEQRDPVYRDVADVVFDVTHTDIEQAVRHLIANHL